MKKLISILATFGLATVVFAANESTVKGPDGKLAVTVGLDSGKPYYSVNYGDAVILEKSPLGLVTTVGNFDKGMSFVSEAAETVKKSYVQDRIKTSFVRYDANKLTYTVKNEAGVAIDIVFQVSDNDIAFRYVVNSFRNRFSTAYSMVVLSEATGFDFPDNTTTFLTPQATPMTGFARSKPSYEETYCYDAPIGEKSKYNCGYTFPALFHIGDSHWALVSETGVSSEYVGSHLSDPAEGGLYCIEFPNEKEINGWGSTGAAMELPASTPWRTITIGNNLAPIVETTVPYDVVDPLYEPSQVYVPGRSTWSWIMWGDGATCYEDQVTYIDFASDMEYEYCLVDALWDTQIGRDRIAELSRYAQSKGVGLFLWYNSNGAWNDAPQGPRGRMSSSIVRHKEMKWLKEIGVKGLKVDFFGSDKQPMMQVYEDILSEANEYGLMIIFHGCTIPRGWERMYPNYVGSEAVLASENLMFGQKANDDEALSACTHTFIRNALGVMEFGGSPLNKHWNRDNVHGNTRRTTDAFELSTAVLFQNPVQNFALAPNNLYDVPAFEMDFMKAVPTTWDEVRFIDGYPGKYCVMARRHGTTWYICGINAEQNSKKLEIDLSAFGFKGESIYCISDCADGSTREDNAKVKNNRLKIEMQTNGGFVATF